MRHFSYVGLALVFVAAAFMVVPTGAALPGAPTASAVHSTPLAPAPLAPGAPPSAASSVASPLAPSHGADVLAKLNAAHVPMRDVFLPNFNARPTSNGQLVTPGYVSAPAPMGLGYFGIEKVHGANVGTISYTQSVEGSATLNRVDPLYVASSSPDIFTMQLNTVLTGVDVLGNTTGQYWIQNVPIYFADSQTLAIEDNIWNFSSPTAGMQSSTLYSYGGNLVAPVFYYAVGPAWYMPTPFTVRLYNNASVVNDRPTIYFNYSITAANGSVLSGSFDQVEFNSTGLATPTAPAPMPTFQINGKQTNPLGLLNDAEIMIGGPGGGSTTSLLDIQGSMGLWTLPNGSSRYVSVPAGYSFGTDTGETSEGIAEWSNGGSHPMAMLGPGPSLLQPLFGLVGAHSGYVREKVSLTPSNAFVFVSEGRGGFNTSSAAWAPVPPTGSVTYLLTPGTYAFKFLLSDYRPVTRTVAHSATLSVSLAADSSLGVYTPLWAWGNSQLAAISQPGGLGTRAHPYVLVNNAVGPIDPLFGEFNDYYYPVFPGIFLAYTTANVTIDQAPSFPIAYTLPVEALFSAFFGTPFSNNLQFEFYHADHVSLVNTPLITGWFFAQDPYFANVLFWDSSYALIGANTFSVQSTALILYGGTHNTVWGNVFTSATTTASNPSAILNGASQNALQLYESGDLVYNNEFGTPVPAMTPGFDFYSGAPTAWTDRWNVPVQAATNGRMVNGFNLTGSILGLSWIGGNFWSTYGSASDPYGVLPYTDGGLITTGGDYHPLTPSPLYVVKFTETGLPSGTSWSVTLNGITLTTNGTFVRFLDPNGTYAFVVAPVTGYTATPSSGAVVLNGANHYAKVVWT